MMFSSPHLASRKFIDLIFNASSKYANWDPPKKIEVGDFGTINKESGQFEKEGNIYELPSTKDVASLHPPIASPRQDSMIVTSISVKRADFSADPQAQVPGLAEASIKGRWEFGHHRGALLVMDKPRIRSIPPLVLLKELVNVEELEGKVLVTEITTCPAYSLYLSQKNNDHIDLALRAAVPVLAAPGLSAGGGLGASWWNSGASGVWSSGTDVEETSYTPLYVVKKIRKKGRFRRDSPAPEPENDQLWTNADVPWDNLDDDGEEIEFEDTVYDD